MKVKHTHALLGATLALLAGLSSLIGPAADAQAPDLLKALQPDDAQLAKGAELYVANCASCHGDKGDGNGLAAAALNPKPRNFLSKDAWKNGQTFSGLWKTLEEGLPGTPMGAFSHLPAKDRVAIINHIRSLAKANYPDVNAAEVETLQKDYGLADQLNKAAAQAISVDKAIELLIAEDAPRQAKVKQALSKLGNQPLAGVSQSERALTVLSHAGEGWRGNLQDFSRMVMYSSDSNGFSAGTGSYTSSQWQTLHNQLKQIF